ncbi:MAG: hypothetical protein DRN53_05415, partial [Thermoprotei archaeon]
MDNTIWNRWLSRLLLILGISIKELLLISERAETMKSFYVKNGCFYYKGKPFIKTSAYHGGDYIITLPEELVTTDKNLYLKAGFTSADFFAPWRRVRPSEDEWNLEPLRVLLRRARKM